MSGDGRYHTRSEHWQTKSVPALLHGVRANRSMHFCSGSTKLCNSRIFRHWPLTMDENDILTTHHLAHAWGVERHVAQRRAARWAQRLGIKRVKARSPSGQVISAYSRGDGERIIEAQRERKARRESNTALKNEKAKEIEFQIGTSNRRDVMTVHELAKILSVSRSHASQIARRLGGKLGIKRVEARAASTHQKIVAYLRSDGERLIKLFKEKRAAKSARRGAKEKRKRERERIPQPRHRHHEMSFFI